MLTGRARAGAAGGQARAEHRGVRHRAAAAAAAVGAGAGRPAHRPRRPEDRGASRCSAGWGRTAPRCCCTRWSTAEDMGERRAYFSALKEMTEGGELLVHMLSHDQWFVVRNVADLCGGDAAGEGGARAGQAGGRTPTNGCAARWRGAGPRSAGAGAVEPLRRALRDPAPACGCRRPRAIDGRRNRGLAMSLAVAADEESTPDVQREMYLALGRIGSAEAIQALRQGGGAGGQTVPAQAVRGAAGRGGGAARRRAHRGQRAQGTAPRRRPRGA